MRPIGAARRFRPLLTTAPPTEALTTERPVRLLMVLQVTHHEGGVAVAQMDADAASNAFSPPTMAALAAGLDALMEAPEVRAIVLTGSGRMFCAGADVNDFQAHLEAGTATRLVQDLTGELHPLLQRMRASPTVVVAAVNGAAAGGGMGLALACDARIASPDARFAAAFFRMGLSPDGGSTWLLPRLIGTQRARRFIFDNEVLGSEEAHRIGLVDQVTTTDRLLEDATDLARRWGAWGVHSRESAKRLLDAQETTGFGTQLDLERGMIATAAGTPDFAEGVEAFLSKREPRFE